MEINLLKWLGTPTNEPTVCAVSGLSTVGAHHARHSLGDGYYVYVNDDVNHLLNDGHRVTWYDAVAKAHPAPKSRPTVKKDNKELNNDNTI